MYRTVVTICTRTAVTVYTAQWSLYVPRSCRCMYRTVVTMYRTVVAICTAQLSLYVPHSGRYMYRTVAALRTTSLTQIIRSAHTVYVFCVDLRTNSDYFTVQH